MEDSDVDIVSCFNEIFREITKIKETQDEILENVSNLEKKCLGRFSIIDDSISNIAKKTDRILIKKDMESRNRQLFMSGSFSKCLPKIERERAKNEDGLFSSLDQKVKTSIPNQEQEVTIPTPQTNDEKLPSIDTAEILQEDTFVKPKVLQNSESPSEQPGTAYVGGTDPPVKPKVVESKKLGKQQSKDNKPVTNEPLLPQSVPESLCLDSLSQEITSLESCEKEDEKQAVVKTSLYRRERASYLTDNRIIYHHGPGAILDISEKDAHGIEKNTLSFATCPPKNSTNDSFVETTSGRPDVLGSKPDSHEASKLDVPCEQELQRLGSWETKEESVPLKHEQCFQLQPSEDELKIDISQKDSLAPTSQEASEDREKLDLSMDQEESAFFDSVHDNEDDGKEKEQNKKDDEILDTLSGKDNNNSINKQEKNNQTEIEDGLDSEDAVQNQSIETEEEQKLIHPSKVTQPLNLNDSVEEREKNNQTEIEDGLNSEDAVQNQSIETEEEQKLIHPSKVTQPLNLNDSVEEREKNNHTEIEDGLDSEDAVQNQSIETEEEQELIHPSKVTQPLNLNDSVEETDPKMGVEKEELEETKSNHRGLFPSEEPGPVQMQYLRDLCIQVAKAAANCSEPKSPGADTVICIDASESMGDIGLEEAKNFVSNYLDGAEKAAKDNYIEENIALVSIGKSTGVVQHLTNDYNKIRDALYDIEAGGPSPVKTGLVLCMSAIHVRGGSVVIHNHKVMPRIILLSDGLVTDCQILTGPDDISLQKVKKENVYQDLLKMAAQLSTEKRKVFCVPCGENPDLEFLEKLAQTTGAELEDKEIAYIMGRNFLLQNIASEVLYRLVMGTAQSDDIGLKKITKEICSKFTAITDEDERKVLQLVKEELKNFNIQLPWEHLKIGMRVRRGPDWTFDDQDSGTAGTVIQIKHKSRSLVVKWDSGVSGIYRYGAKKDVQVVNEPRILMPGETIAIGVKCVRGVDWVWDDQDGGPGNIGTVFQVEDNGVVHVSWENGKKGNYRFGLNGKWDLAVITEDNKEKDKPKVERPVWQWKNEKTWETFTDDNNEKIEKLFQKKGKGTCIAKLGNESYRVVIENQSLTHINSNNNTSIRRIVSEQ